MKTIVAAAMFIFIPIIYYIAAIDFDLVALGFPERDDGAIQNFKHLALLFGFLIAATLAPLFSETDANKEFASITSAFLVAVSLPFLVFSIVTKVSDNQSAAVLIGIFSVALMPMIIAQARRIPSLTA
jgi:hypothetical protein